MPANSLATAQDSPGKARVIDDLRDLLLALLAEVAIGEAPSCKWFCHATDHWHARVLVVLVEAVENVLQHAGRHVYQGLSPT